MQNQQQPMTTGEGAQLPNRPPGAASLSGWPARELFISALLVLVTLAVYWPVRHYDYVNHDDPVYVYENPQVLGGLSWGGVAWAFGKLTGEHTYWHPVTWLSIMLDSELFGPGAGPRHVGNVLLHVANAVLLFLLLRRMTGACWRSAAVAALFAWHPLQVDSVAWIAERKNVLSTLFWLLTVWAYVRYALQSSVHGPQSTVRGPRRAPTSYLPSSSSSFYSLTLVFFALGLMSKPMLVTVPVILLLLDYWPLRRLLPPGPSWQVLAGEGPPLAPVSLARAVLEKLPLFMMSAASAVITVVGHKQLGSLVDEGVLPFSARLGNALVSYVRYLQKMFWPTGLAVHYPHPGTWPPVVVGAATAILVAVSVWTLVAWRRRPYLLVGWLWFVVALLPTIGLIQASSQAMADRFAYVPLIGVFIMLVWLAGDLLAGWRYRVTVEPIVMLAVLLSCLAATSRQLRYWSDGEALFRRAVAVTKSNYLAEYSLGCALGQKNKLDDALDHFAAALRIKPDYAEAHDNSGVVLQMQGKSAAAEAEFRIALRLKPDMVRSRNNLGLALQSQGKTGEALAEFHQVLRAHPDNPEAHNNLGKTLAEQGKLADAMTEFEEAIRLKPDYAGAHFNLGNAFVMKGNPAGAVAPYLAALQAQPDLSDAHQALGLVLAALGKTNEAAAHFSAALRLKPGDPEAHYGLGDLLLRQGKAGEATQQFRAAIKNRPDYPEAHYQLGVILAGRRETAEAITHYREAVRLKPDWLEALNNLAWILATQPDEKLRDGREAVRLAAHAVTLTRTNNPGALDTLAAAYAESGNYPAAVETAQKAAGLALAAGQKEMAAEIQRRRQAYAAGRPFHE